MVDGALLYIRSWVRRDCGVGVSTFCRAISTLGTSVFVP